MTDATDSVLFTTADQPHAASGDQGAVAQEGSAAGAWTETVQGVWAMDGPFKWTLDVGDESLIVWVPTSHDA